MDQFMANLPPIDMNANGVMSVGASAPVQSTPVDPNGAQKRMPLPMSSDVLSVLLQLQNNNLAS